MGPQAVSGIQNVDIYCTGATWRPKSLFGLDRVLLERLKVFLGPAPVPPVQSKCLPGLALAPPERSKWVFELAALPPERSKWSLGLALVPLERSTWPLGLAPVASALNGRSDIVLC